MIDEGRAVVDNNVSEGLIVTSLVRSCYKEMSVTVKLGDNESARSMFARVASWVREMDASILSQEVFGLPSCDTESLDVAFGDVDWPVTWIETGSGTGLAGTQLWVVSGVDVEPVEIDGCVVGTTFDDGFARYCRLGGIVCNSGDMDREGQARATFETMETVLRSAGMDFCHVVRTWFYNNDILDWYGGFNKVRDTFFSERNLFDRIVPASTGVGGVNSAGTALVGGLLAVAPHDDRTSISAVGSPLQCPALDYGSSFSRAVEVVTPDYRRLFVSGTASIEPGGETVHIGDVEGQINLTLDVVAAILKSNGMSWQDTTRGIAYLRRPEDAVTYSALAAARGISDLPILVTENTICRDNLLFELEMDAVSQNADE